MMTQNETPEERENKLGQSDEPKLAAELPAKPIPEAPASLIEIPDRWKKRLPGLLLVALVILAYLPAFRGGFIWDDDAHVIQNPCVVGPKGLKEIWTTSAARICPLVLSTFNVQYTLWGANPLPFHLLNIVLHGLCAWVLWRVLLRLGVPGAWLGAALWALHPVQVESVAWITELKNVQSCLFYLLTVLFFTRWLTERSAGKKTSQRSYMLAVLFGLLAMSSKSATVILPLVLGLIAWWIEGRWKWRNLAWLAPFVVLAMAASILSMWTQHIEGANDLTSERSLAQRLVVAGKVLWFYLGKLAWPNPLIFIYPRWKIAASNILEWLPSLSLLTLLGVLYCRRKSWGRPYYFALAYFTVALLPVLGILNHYFLRYSFVGDHFQYLASIGPLAFAGAVLARLTKYPGPIARYCRWTAGAGLLLVMGALSSQHGKNFRSSEILWADTLEKNSECWMAHLNLGVEMQGQGHWDEAVQHCRTALQIKPDYVEAHVNWGNVLQNQGRFQEAISHYEAALKIKPGSADAFVNWGNALLSQGQVEEAIKLYQTALKFKPDFVEAHINWGNAVQRQGRIEDAIKHYETAVQTNGGYADAHIYWGNALQSQFHFDEAIQHYQTAVQIQPNHAQAHYILGLALQNAGRLTEAVSHYEYAVQIKPDFADVQNSWASALKTQGQPELAIEHFQAALSINPDNAVFMYNLGSTLASLGRVVEAQGILQRALQLATDQNNQAVKAAIEARLSSLQISQKPF